MLDVLFPFAGGLGLFLIGMMLLSEGLVAFAGGALQRVLLMFTGRPIKAFLSGAVMTALAQSSTATTVMLIGFVSAGLISFNQAIGVVIGASLGNTATGWIVATLGLKVSLGFYTLPLIAIGALTKLLAVGLYRELGRALAGFGMLFLGLGMLQDGMQGLAAIFSLAQLPSGGYGAYGIAVLIGVALTAVLQSSTAAIAMTLTALDAGAISFEQAAALVIGAAIGTTLTGVLVSIGGTLYAKRTAVAYILFNVVAGLIALLLLPFFLRGLHAFSAFLHVEPGAIALAAFHSLFIAIGALIFLPLTDRFAAFVHRLVPERNAQGEHYLDASLLGLPTVALETSERTLKDIALQLLALQEQILAMQVGAAAGQTLQQTGRLLDEAYEFVVRIQLSPEEPDAHARCSAQLHAMDHLRRWHNRLTSLLGETVNFRDPVYHEAIAHAQAACALAQQGLRGDAEDGWTEGLGMRAAALAELLSQTRQDMLMGGSADAGAAYAFRTTDIYRWIERTCHHIWRASHYLGGA